MKRTITALIVGVLIGAIGFGTFAIASDLVVVPSTQGVYVDGTAATVDAYNINGSNYFKARDFAAAMDVGMWYDEASRSIKIETDKRYDAAYAGPEKTTTPAKPEPASPTQGTTYKEGTYLVGKDIAPGLYRVTATSAASMAYVARASDVSLELKDIIANGNFTGPAYVTIKSGDTAVKISGGFLTKIDLSSLDKDIKSSVGSGVYLVGYDIMPGTYKVTSESAMAYVARLSDTSMELDDIIANELFSGDGYVKVDEGDFAVKVSGATLTVQ